MSKGRLLELDILRSLGTLVIVFHHLPDYAGNFYNLAYFGLPINLSYVNVLNTYVGLGIFVFVSGFVLYYTNPRVDRVFSFLKRRILRIFPMYLVALALFAVTVRRLSMSEAFIHVLGLPILLAPRFVVPMPTLWFVGLIVVLYVFYALLVKYAPNYLGMALFSLVSFGLVYLVRHFFYVVEYRFFLYFFIFLAGVFCSKMRLFDRRDFGVSYLLIAMLVLCVAIVAFRSFHKGPIYDYGEVTEAFVSQAPITDIFTVSVAVDMIMLATVFVTFTLAKKLTRYLNERITRFLSFVSFSSYGVYLFHRPVLDAMTTAFRLVFPAHHAYWRLLYLVALGLPLVFALSYIAQVLSDKMMERLDRLVPA